MSCFVCVCSRLLLERERVKFFILFSWLLLSCCLTLLNTNNHQGCGLRSLKVDDDITFFLFSMENCSFIRLMDQCTLHCTANQHSQYNFIFFVATQTLIYLTNSPRVWMIWMRPNYFLPVQNGSDVFIIRSVISRFPGPDTRSQLQHPESG